MRCTCSITFFFFFFAFRVLAGKSGEEEKSEKKRCKGDVARHVSDMAASTRRYPSFRLNVHTHVQHFGGGVYIQWEKEEKIKAHSGVLLYTISWSAAQSDRGCTGVVVRDPFFGPRQVWQTFFLFFQGREPCSALQISRQKHVIVPNKRMSNNKPYRLSFSISTPTHPGNFSRESGKNFVLLFFLFILINIGQYTLGADSIDSGVRIC